MKANARERLAALVDPAISQLSRLLRANHPSVTLGAAKDVLDRNGFKGPEKLHVSTTAAELTEKELNTLRDDELQVLLAAIKIRARVRGSTESAVTLGDGELERAAAIARSILTG